MKKQDNSMINKKLFIILLSVFIFIFIISSVSAVISEYEVGTSAPLSEVMCFGGQPNNDGSLVFYQSCSSFNIYMANLSNSYNISSNQTAITAFNKNTLFGLTISSRSYHSFKLPERFSKDGLNFYLIMENDSGEDMRVAQYKLTSPWNLSTATSYGQIQVDNSVADRFSIANVHSSGANDLDISDDGKLMALSFLTWNDFNQTEGRRNTSIILTYNLNTPFDITTGVANYSGLLEGVREVITGDVGNTSQSRLTEGLFNFTQLSSIAFGKQDSISFYNSGSTAFIVSLNLTSTSNGILTQYDLNNSPYRFSFIFGGIKNITSIQIPMNGNGYFPSNLIIFNDTEFNVLGYVGSAGNDLSERNLSLGKPLVVLVQGSGGNETGSNSSTGIVGLINPLLGFLPEASTLSTRQKFMIVIVTLLSVSLLLLYVAHSAFKETHSFILYLIGFIDVAIFFFFVAISYISVGIVIIIVLISLGLAYLGLRGKKT